MGVWIGWIVLFLHLTAPRAGAETNGSWLVKAGGLGDDGLTGLTLAPNGDILFTGLLDRGARFGAISISDSTANGFFLARYNALGEPVWVKAASGDLTSRGFSVAMDADGNLFVTGIHHDVLQLGNGVYVAATETQPGAPAAFTAAFSGSGEAQWAQPWSGALLEHPDGKALLNQAFTAWEDGVVTSEFVLNIINNQGELSPVARGKQKTGASLPDPFVLSVALAPDGTILMAGALRPQQEVTLDPGFSLVKTNPDFSMGYLSRFAPDGSPLSLLEHRYGQLAVDIHSNLFVVFRPLYGVYVEKYDSGGKLLWERGFDPQAQDHTSAWTPPFADPLSLAAGVSPIALDSAGNLFFATSSLIRELSPDGDLFAQRQISLTGEGSVTLARFRLLPDGKVIVGGTFSGRLLIGDLELTSEGVADIFLGKVTLQRAPGLLSWTPVGNGIILTWAKGFVLQSATRLDPANWRDESALSPVTVWTDTGSQFFRLRSE
jgi:hypothetical protein